MELESRVLFALLYSVLTGEAMQKELKETLQEKQLHKVLKLAEQHALLPPVAEALFRQGLVLTGEVADNCRELSFQAVLQYQLQSGELLKLSKLFNENKIPHIPLKGAVMREYYPEPWFRTSLDLDVLVHEKDLAPAMDLLEAQGYQLYSRSAHDVSFISQTGVQVELHYTLASPSQSKSIQAVLETVWHHATPKDDSFFYTLSDEMYYFYHLAHMAKHVENGGCGIRPLVDLWILNQSVCFEPTKRQNLLEQGGLLKFDSAARKLAQAWLFGEEMDALSQVFHHYILSGGVFGGMENRAAIQQKKQGGKLRFLMRRMFLPYDVMKKQYPVLQKHKWLLPIMEIHRMGRLSHDGKLKKSVYEWKTTQTLSAEKQNEAEKLRDYLGLS